MGKKGTKRKTKWRALPLGEEAGGSGNEEELHDEDQSTASSVIGQSNTSYRKPWGYHKGGDRYFRPNRRFTYDRFRSKEPLVKLESKTFDEEEYTKITTPRQDVLFKKGCFGKKRESSAEESMQVVEMDGEEPMMDQIIITNGFVDERGHYLVNGNSYEIYDPYSNTVTVVVGPPPYTNGVTQPVLAAVSCQPVPLQPVEWYPPGSDWPSQGSAWTPSYHRNSHPDSLNSPGQNCENPPGFPGPDPQIPNLYHQPAYVVPGYVYSESPVYNGVPVHTSNPNPTIEAMCSNESEIDNEMKKTRRKSLELSSVDEKPEKNETNKEAEEKGEEPKQPVEMTVETSSPTSQESLEETQPKPVAEPIAQEANDSPISEPVEAQPETPTTTKETESSTMEVESQRIEVKLVEKQSHSTQTNIIETNSKDVHHRIEIPSKESHSTQTLPEEEEVFEEVRSGVGVGVGGGDGDGGGERNGETFSSNKMDLNKQKENEKNENNKSLSNVPLNNSMTKPEPEAKASWKPQPNKYKDYYSNNSNSPPKKFQDDQSRKTYQKRTNFSDERKLRAENVSKVDAKPETTTTTSSPKISYARKAMIGLESLNDGHGKMTNGTTTSPNNQINKQVPNGYKTQNQNPIANGGTNNSMPTANGMNNRTNCVKQTNSNDRYYNNNSYDEKRNQQNNGNNKNGYMKPRYNRSSSGGGKGSAGVERTNQKDFKYKERKAVQLKPFVVKSAEKIPEKYEETVSESRSQSEKSSTVSELSSPTELSSGQNTPPEKIIVRKMEQKIANEINKSFEEKLKKNLTKTNDEDKSRKAEHEAEEMKKEKEKEENKEKSDAENGEEETPRTKPEEGKKKKNKNKPEVEKPKESTKPKKTKRKKRAAPEESKDKSESDNSNEEIPFLPSFIRQKPQDLLFGSWEGMKDDTADFISEMKSILTDDDKILKSLGINEDKMSFSKLPLHSDVLMVLPAFGWGRPKMKLEDFFSPSENLNDDLFTKKNITNMKSTKPEEFFASVIDGPIVEKGAKKKENTNNTNANNNTNNNSNNNKNGKKEGAKSPRTSSSKDEPAKEPSNSNAASAKKNVNLTKTGYKVSKNNVVKSKGNKDEVKEKKSETETDKDVKLGIVEAVNSWLQEQGDSEKVLSLDSLSSQATENAGTMIGSNEDPECVPNGVENEQKNGTSNPIHALSRNEVDSASIADFREGSGCMRVANVINDGFVHVDREFYGKKKRTGKESRMYRSSSWDAKLSDVNIKKHFKFLTDSASFCQDLISDVRNGLPTKNEYATEELCDPKQSVSKYYILAPGRTTMGKVRKEKVKTVVESDSENEVFEALEYKFLTEDNLRKQESDEKSPSGTGNASITDSGVHSDMESSEDATNDQQKEANCKLQ